MQDQLGYATTTGQKRFGEALGDVVPLSAHDIDEILCEQTSNRRPFGDIALSLGLCQPEHVWQAWLAQLMRAVTPPTINLNKFDIDAQAISLINGEVAERLQIVPLRVFGDVLIVAASRESSDAAQQSAVAELSQRTTKDVRCVMADGAQILNAIERHYFTVAV